MKPLRQTREFFLIVDGRVFKCRHHPYHGLDTLYCTVRTALGIMFKPTVSILCRQEKTSKSNNNITAPIISTPSPLCRTLLCVVLSFPVVSARDDVFCQGAAQKAARKALIEDDKQRRAAEIRNRPGIFETMRQVLCSVALALCGSVSNICSPWGLYCMRRFFGGGLEGMSRSREKMENPLGSQKACVDTTRCKLEGQRLFPLLSEWLAAIGDFKI